MRYRKLGCTGVEVVDECLGTMMFGGIGNKRPRRVRRSYKAIDAGINFIDTADVYSQGESERIVGKVIKGPARRPGASDQVLQLHRPRANYRGASRRWINAAVRALAAAARTDHLDLYQVHR